MRKTQREGGRGRREGGEVETEKKARIRQKQQQQKKHTSWLFKKKEKKKKSLVTSHNAYCQTKGGWGSLPFLFSVGISGRSNKHFW